MRSIDSGKQREVPLIFPAIPRRRVTLLPGQLRLIARLALAGQWRRGPDRAEFERLFAEQMCVPEAVSFGSGRAALRAICRALQLAPGAEIILPAYTDQSVPQTLIDLGLRPVFADIEATSHNLDPARAAEKIGPATRAIIATHLFGRPCRLAEITELARANNLKLIEDCAHSYGATYGGRPVGVFGDGAFFSFAATKILGTMGGGMAVCRRPEDTAAVRRAAEAERPPSVASLARKVFAAYVMSWLTWRPFFGLIIYPLLRLIDDPIRLYDRTFRRLLRQKPDNPGGLSNLQSRLGLEKLQSLDRFTGICRCHAARLQEWLDPHIQRLEEPAGAEAVYYFYIVLHPARREMARRLLREGLDTGYRLMRHCAAMFGDSGRYPETERAIAESLQLPIFPLAEDDLRILAETVNRIFRD